jgi:hypothetical protein
MSMDNPPCPVFPPEHHRRPENLGDFAVLTWDSKPNSLSLDHISYVLAHHARDFLVITAAL